MDKPELKSLLLEMLAEEVERKPEADRLDVRLNEARKTCQNSKLKIVLDQIDDLSKAMRELGVKEQPSNRRVEKRQAIEKALEMMA